MRLYLCAKKRLKRILSILLRLSYHTGYRPKLRNAGVAHAFKDPALASRDRSPAFRSLASAMGTSSGLQLLTPSANT